MTTSNTPWIQADRQPSDEEIVAWVREHYNAALAESVWETFQATGIGSTFANHLRRSFTREMLEPVR